MTLYCNEASYRRTTAGSELVNPWSDTEVFVSHGVLYPFLYSVQDMLPVPPEGYQEAVASSALERYPEEAIPEDQKVSVVGIMLEAFCDLTDFPALAEQEGVQEVYAPWHALEEESVSGDLLTNIFAGGTVDTEWCFLTGYSQYEEFRNDVDSYVWYFDWQGYQTRGDTRASAGSITGRTSTNSWASRSTGSPKTTTANWWTRWRPSGIPTCCWWTKSSRICGPVWMGRGGRCSPSQ